MSTTFLKKIEKIFKNAAKPYFMRVSGQKKLRKIRFWLEKSQENDKI